SGERELALIAIRQCVDEAAGDDKASYRRAFDDLTTRLIGGGAVALKHEGRETRFVGSFPLTIGRESVCQVVLRDVGISRAHVEIAWDERFTIRDLESRNGTTLGGVALAPGAHLPLDGRGELGVGPECVMRFEVAAQSLTLEVTRGLDRGLKVVAS